MEKLKLRKLMKLAIRADGGPEKGLGHIVRSATVAKEFLKRDHEVYYLTSTPDAVKSWIDEVKVISIDKSKDNEETVKEVEKNSIDAVFVDYFGAKTEFQEAISQTEAKVAVRQNFQHTKVCCDLMVYGDIYAPDFEYEWTGDKPSFLLGPDYLLLREDFQEIAKKEKKWKENPERALIIMGGSDVNNSTPDIMRQLERFKGTIDVIIGPGFSNKVDIEKTAESLNGEYNLVENPDNLANLMFQADFAITSGGGTAYELLAAKTPFIVIPEVDNQKLRSQSLEERKLAFKSENAGEIEEELDQILDSEKRKELFNNIDGIIDGRGPERVYKAILET
jgi:UDP-2,4-diacetamido-2,4,6-trideoxy-beta-L-altropyranose hydrolase